VCRKVFPMLFKFVVTSGLPGSSALPFDPLCPRSRDVPLWVPLYDRGWFGSLGELMFRRNVDNGLPCFVPFSPPLPKSRAPSIGTGTC